jgi:hypothetical protein
MPDIFPATSLIQVLVGLKAPGLARKSSYLTATAFGAAGAFFFTEVLRLLL